MTTQHPYNSKNDWNESFKIGQDIEKEVVEYLTQQFGLELIPYAYDANNNPLYYNDNSDFDFVMRRRNPNVPDLDTISDEEKWINLYFEVKSDSDMEGNIRAGNMTTLFFENSKINKGKKQDESYPSGIFVSKADFVVFASVGTDCLYISELEAAKDYIQKNYYNRNGVTLKYSNWTNGVAKTTGYSVQFSLLDFMTSPFKKYNWHSKSQRERSINKCNEILLERDKNNLKNIKKDEKVNVRALF